MWWLTHLVSSWWWDNSLECMSSVHPAEPGWLSLDSHLLSLLCAISSTSCAFFWFCLVQLFLCVCSLAISKACTVHLWGHTVYCLWRTYSKACEHRGGPIGQMGAEVRRPQWLLGRLPSRVCKVVHSFWIPSVGFNPWLLWSSSPYPWVMQITLVFWGVWSNSKRHRPLLKHPLLLGEVPLTSLSFSPMEEATSLGTHISVELCCLQVAWCR